MVLGAVVKVIWLTREISGMNINDHFQWLVVGYTEIFEMVKKKKMEEWNRTRDDCIINLMKVL